MPDLPDTSPVPHDDGRTAEPLAETDPRTAFAMLRDGHAVLLDVREQDEWDAGHAPDAVHRPLGQLDPAAVSWPTTGLAAGQGLIAVCRSGKRSAMAVARLAEGGVTALNLNGGMQAWQAAGLPVVKDDESAGTVA